ncbi:MAG: tRNA (cytosine(32)/uridine(32)-2'-O)-methyltransferase TrmJ [Porticoccaceae bacterium]|nr:tRNA (cytosine(32)/uridine(32)-2'-O)-methyltransferase TrmJ [Porticoccaceae bacterium]
MSTSERQAKIRIVLVNTSHPGNIGGAARAMKNMGLAELYLVEPREYPAPRAVWRAAGARDVLANAKIVGSVDEAIKDCGLVIGTSARERRIPWPLINPRECGDKIWQEARSHNVALLFGREDRGLTNSELQKCHYHVHIPSNPDYSSLNLATAVQVLSYEIRMASLARKDGNLPEMNEWDQPLATADELELFHDHLATTMADLKFYDPDNPKQLLTRMRRLFNRTRMDKMEVSMLRGLLSAAQRKRGK